MKVRILLNDAGRRVGESHPRAKLTDAEIELVHALAGDGMSLAEIGRKMGMSREGVWKVVHGYRRGQAVARVLYVSVGRS